VVSDPVPSGPNRLSQAVVSASVPPGAAMPNFVVTCDGRTSTCTCNGVNACRGIKGYDGAAMNTIVFGRGSSSCSDAKSGDGVGMCDIFPRITPANVKMVYVRTGLGYGPSRRADANDRRVATEFAVSIFLSARADGLS
jgi:hypothetical protein